MKTQKRKKHLGLWWLVLVLGLTNAAIFLEAGHNQAFSEPVAVAASADESPASTGSVAGHVASISVTIGSGLIILGAGVIWVSRFVQDLAATPPTSRKTKYAEKTIKKDNTRMANSLKTTSKKVARTVKADAKKVEKGAKKAARTVKADAKKVASKVKADAKKLKKNAKADAKVLKSGAKSVGRTIKSTAKKLK